MLSGPSGIPLPASQSAGRSPAKKCSMTLDGCRAEVEHSVKFRLVANMSPVVVIAVLFATTGVLPVIGSAVSGRL